MRSSVRGTWHKGDNAKYILEVLIIAVIYYGTARLGQTLAIPPGNITPVWLPSGILLGAVFIRGYSIWPGIFLGAFVGNVWAYIDFNSIQNIAKCIFTGTANGIGDVLCIAGSAYVLNRSIKSWNPFNESAGTIKFIIYCVIAGPAVSAIFGVTALLIVGFIELQGYFYTLMTWWTGDGVGALVIAPCIIVWIDKQKKIVRRKSVYEYILFWIILMLTAVYCLKILPFDVAFNLPMFSFAPILIWASFRLGQKVTFAAVFAIACMSIVVTALGQGPFAGKVLNISLTELQWFIAVMTITIFLMNAVIQQGLTSANALEKSHQELEKKVTKRTSDLVISNQKLEKEVAKTKKSELMLKRSLNEKEVLLREVHHRVKNNMQIIQSLINLQSKKINDRGLQQLMQESSNRIRTMAIIHETLYRSDDFSNLNLTNYLEILVEGLVKSYPVSENRIHWKVEVEAVQLDIDKSIACGLIVNELVTNSLKYAFVDTPKGQINVQLFLSGDNEVTLIVKDNGPGVPARFDLQSINSLGLKIVSMLAEDQLMGSIVVKNDGGLKVKVKFPFAD